MKTTLIVGAGLAGLTVAQKLKGHHQVTIIEKSRGLGGRVATRRIEDLGMDHGAPYLALEAPFLAAHPSLNFLTDQHGSTLRGGMAQLPKLMALGLEVHKNQKAINIQRVGLKWEVRTEEEQIYQCDHLVITAPLPQAIELLDKSLLRVSNDLRGISYSKAIMLLMLTDSARHLKSTEKNGHILLAMNERKLHPDGLILRANRQISEKFFDHPDEEGIKILHTILKDEFKLELEIRGEEYKKWRYCLPLTTSPLPFAEVAPSIFLTGDAFLCPNAQGSLRSADALATFLLSE